MNLAYFHWKWWLAGPALVLVLSTWCQLHGRALGVEPVGLGVSMPWAIRSTVGWMLAGIFLAGYGERVISSITGKRNPCAARVLLALAIPVITLGVEVILLSGDNPLAIWLYDRLPLHLPFGALLFAGYLLLRARQLQQSEAQVAAPAPMEDFTPIDGASIPDPPVLSVEVMTGTGHTRVALDDIECLEADRNYVNVHTPQRSYLLRQTLCSLERSLRPDTFLRIHRSIIVNREKIRERRRGGVLVLHSGRTVRMSRAFTDRASELLR